MSLIKRFDLLLTNDDRLSDSEKLIVRELLERAKPEAKPALETPHEEITEEMLNDARHGLVKTVTPGGILWYVNPEKKRWIKASSSMGKFFSFYFKDRAETQLSFNHQKQVLPEGEQLKKDIVDFLDKSKFVAPRTTFAKKQK